MTVCRNAIQNGAIGTYILQSHESTIRKIFVVSVVLMEAVFPCFNLNPND